MMLAVEALSVAHSRHINRFAIASSDRDYVPLLNKLRELGRMVIGIGVSRENVSPIYVQACDQFFYYVDLLQVGEAEGVPIGGDTANPNLHEAFKVLQRAVAAIEEAGQEAYGARLAPFMRQLMPDFSLSALGCASFKEFIQKAEEARKVTVDWQGHVGDYIVKLKPGVKTDALKPSFVPLVDYKNPTQTAHYYKKLLERKLRVPYPSLSERRKTLQALERTYFNLSKSGAVCLTEWSEETYRRELEGGKVNQTTVFKILSSLYLAKCFEFTPTDNIYNPMITGLLCEPSMWEEKMYEAQLRGMLITDPQVVLVPEAISWLFYEDLGHIEEANKLINAVRPT